MLSFRLPNGAYGTLDTRWSRPASYPTWRDVRIEIDCELGTARLDAFKQNLALSSEQKGLTQWICWGSDMDLSPVRGFVDAIVTVREPTTAGEDGLGALEVALAAYRSAERHEPIALSLR